MKMKWVNLKQKKFHNMCFYTQEWNLKVIHFSFADCSSKEYKIYGTAKKKEQYVWILPHSQMLHGEGTSEIKA